MKHMPDTHSSNLQTKSTRGPTRPRLGKVLKKQHDISETEDYVP